MNREDEAQPGTYLPPALCCTSLPVDQVYSAARLGRRNVERETLPAECCARCCSVSHHSVSSSRVRVSRRRPTIQTTRCCKLCMEKIHRLAVGQEAASRPFGSRYNSSHTRTKRDSPFGQPCPPATATYHWNECWSDVVHNTFFPWINCLRKCITTAHQ